MKERAQVAAYLPRALVDELARRPHPLSEPWAKELSGALMVADISGFTSLAERLAEQGPAGAEQLSEALNVYFAKLVDITVAHGGDVLRFAGDAPMVLFAAGSEPGSRGLERATTRAAACGLALQAALHDHPVGHGVSLSMRVFVTAGRLLAAAVGGIEGRWEFVLGGQPLVDLAVVARSGKAGQVLAAASCAALLPDCEIAPGAKGGPVRVLRLRQATPPAAGAEAAVASVEAMEPFVPRSVLHCLSAGDTGWLAEIRRVTVAFTNIEGVDFLRDDVLGTLQEAFAAVQTAVYRHGGSINQFLVEDKGLTVLALWGVPLHTHEDDAARAASAMLEVEQALRAVGVTGSSGLTTARVFCGHRGSSVRREYAVVGRSVNLAARLMMQAARDSTIERTA